MIKWLSERTWGRVVLIPVVIAVGAFSWFSIIDGTKNAQDKSRTFSLWGWLDSRLDSQWDLFKSNDSRYHLLKNMGSEWAKLDGQRAYKAFSFLLVLSIVLGVVLGILNGKS